MIIQLCHIIKHNVHTDRALWVCAYSVSFIIALLEFFSMPYIMNWDTYICIISEGDVM